MIFHICALLIGCVLELVIGKPWKIPTADSIITKIIEFLQRVFIGDNLEFTVRDEKEEKRKGLTTLIVAIIFVYLVVALVIGLTYLIHPAVGMIFEAAAVYFMISVKDIANAYKQEGASLDEEGIVAFASVMSVVANTKSVTPLFFFSLGGAPLAYVYLTVNVYSNMIKSGNERLRSYGWAAVSLDHIIDYIPARLSALYTCLVAKIVSGQFSYANTSEIYDRDRNLGNDTNDTQTPAAFAGALGIELKVANFVSEDNNEKTTLVGKMNHEPAIEDLNRSRMLLYLVSVVGLIAAILFKLIFAVIF